MLILKTHQYQPKMLLKMRDLKSIFLQKKLQIPIKKE